MIPVIVPSYQRARCLSRKTLPLLLDRQVPIGTISVVVADGRQADEYRATIADHGLPVPLIEVAAPGIRAVRNWIADNYRGPVMEIDDDLTDVAQWADPKHTAPVPSLPELFEEGFAHAASAGAKLWGIYPVPNPYFMRPGIRTDLRYIEAGLFGTVLTGEPYQQITLEDKEDYERSIRYFLHDGAVVRIDYYTFRANYYTEPGGLQATRSWGRIDWSARWLADAYPDLASVNTAKKSRPWTEVRLRDRRPADRRHRITGGYPEAPLFADLPEPVGAR